MLYFTLKSCTYFDSFFQGKLSYEWTKSAESPSADMQVTVVFQMLFQQAFTCTKLTIETLEQIVKYDES